MKEVNLDKNYLQGLFGVVFIPESYKLIRQRFQEIAEKRDLSDVGNVATLEFSYFSMVINNVKKINGYTSSAELNGPPLEIREDDVSRIIQKLPISGI
jgi:hypothetical protein